MNKLPQRLDDLLLRYLDGALNPAEQQDLEKDIATNDALKKRLEQLQTMNVLLKSHKVEQPSKNFTQLVMSKLNQSPGYSVKFPVRNGILLLIGVLLVAAIASVLVPEGVFDNISMTIDLNKVEPAKKYIERTLPAIPVDGKLLVNFIILINLVLGWLVLDRAILKPIFHRRIQQGQ